MIVSATDQHPGDLQKSSGDGLVIDSKGTVGIATDNIETNTALVGTANSMTGLYIGDGSLLFNNTLDRDGGYYISTSVNALNAGPVSLGSTMTLDGTWVIVQENYVDNI